MRIVIYYPELCDCIKSWYTQWQPNSLLSKNDLQDQLVNHYTSRHLIYSNRVIVVQIWCHVIYFLPIQNGDFMVFVISLSLSFFLSLLIFLLSLIKRIWDLLRNCVKLLTWLLWAIFSQVRISEVSYQYVMTIFFFFFGGRVGESKL